MMAYICLKFSFYNSPKDRWVKENVMHYLTRNESSIYLNKIEKFKVILSWIQTSLKLKA